MNSLTILKQKAQYLMGRYRLIRLLYIYDFVIYLFLTFFWNKSIQKHFGDLTLTNPNHVIPRQTLIFFICLSTSMSTMLDSSRFSWYRRGFADSALLVRIFFISTPASKVAHSLLVSLDPLWIGGISLDIYSLHWFDGRSRVIYATWSYILCMHACFIFDPSMHASHKLKFCQILTC